MPLARISLTLSRHFSLSFIASGRSSGPHPVSSHSCWMYVRAGPPAFAQPYMGVHRSISLMCSSLLLQQCPACVVRLTWIQIISNNSVWNIYSFKVKIVLFQTSTHFSSIRPIDRTLSGATTPDQSRPGIDGHETVLRIPQISSITRASLSDCLVSYPGRSLVRSYPSAEIQSVYSAILADWAIGDLGNLEYSIAIAPRSTLARSGSSE